MRKVLLCLIVGCCIAVSAFAESPSELEATILSAIGANPAAAGRLDPVIREIVRQLTPEQKQTLLADGDFDAIFLPSGKSLAGAISEFGFTVFPATVDGGGGFSANGEFEVDGTAGQPDAGYASGESASEVGLAVVGGYWGLVPEEAIFDDGFESGDTSAWSATVGGV
jgi:hypothetical protein